MFRIPDVVTEHLAQNAIDLVPLAPEIGATTDMIKEGHLFYVTREIRQAIVDKDIDTINASRDKNVSDLKANIDNIAKHGEHAWTSPTNPSDNVPYRLSTSDNGWMWCYMIDKEDEPTTVGADPTYKCTISVGSYSRTAKWMGLSMSTLTDVPAKATIKLISKVVSGAVGKFIGRRVERIVFSKAAEEAVQEGAEVLAKESVKYASWLVKGSRWVGGFVGGAVIQTVILFIFKYVVMDFGLELSVYNWSRDEEWDVLEYYGDNADLDPKFETTNLLAITNMQKMPDGTKVVTPDSVTSYAMYTVINHNPVMEGVGAGLKLVSKSDSSRVVYLKYMVRWGAPDNKFGVGTSKTASSLTDYYKNASWDTSGNRTTEIKIPAGGPHPEMPVRGLTPALKGDKDHLYSFEVHIGDVPTSA